MASAETGDGRRALRPRAQPMHSKERRIAELTAAIDSSGSSKPPVGRQKRKKRRRRYGQGGHCSAALPDVSLSSPHSSGSRVLTPWFLVITSRFRLLVAPAVKKFPKPSRQRLPALCALLPKLVRLHW